ncbi:MAG: glycosyltransferase family 2 protein [Flavobacterium sp.]|nr:glycosyltransferase family 2 protein [Flavobacterium sp.]
MNYPSSSLIVSVYNRPEALELLLLSLLNQTVLPNEIIIADDGSGQDIVNLIEIFKTKISIPIIHIWHTDIGNRKPTILNKSIAKSKYDYIIQIDGDIIMNKYFIEDHLNFSESGVYLFGSRVNTQKTILESIFKNKTLNFSFFSKGIRRRGRTIRIPTLMNFAKKINRRSSKLRGCNMSFWKKDFITINGYNENLVEAWREDSEMAERLHNSGIIAKRLKFAGIAYHLYHKSQSQTLISINLEIEKETILKKIKYTDKGINQYL